MTGSKSASEPQEDLDRGARLRARLAGLIAALATAILLVAIQAPLQRQLFDAYQRVLPAPPPSEQVVVVVVDAPSLAEIGGWPWSRYTMARLAERIAGRGAKAIGFDFLFPERDRQTPEDFVRLYYELSPAAAAEIRRQQSMDDIFARVIGRHPIVLARYGVQGDNSYDTLERGETAGVFPPAARFVGPQPKTIPTYPAAGANLDMLDGAAAGHGLANGPPDKGGIVRRVPLLGRPAGVLTPSLALELVRVAEGEETIELEGSPRALQAVRVGRHRVPVDPGGRLLIRFAERPRGPHGERLTAHPTLSAVDVLRRGLPADVLKGKIVLVGLAAAGTSDVVNTATEGQTYGVFVQAQAVDAILRGEGLTTPAWATFTEWGLGLLLVLAAWLFVPRAPLWGVGAAALGAALAALAGSVAVFEDGLLVNPVPMVAPATAATLAMMTLLFVEGRRVQARLRGALESERLSAARVAGELAAAKEIQIGMLAPRSALARLTPKAAIDAVLQPARSVGGDLYDAFLLDERRLCFLVGDVTGKGAPAALFMALSKSLSRSILTRPHADLAAAVRQLNVELSRDNTQAMAVSMLVGVLDLETGGVDMVSAGHEHPLRIHADGGVRVLRLDGGPPLCVDETFPYPLESGRLEPGDTLLVLTDGVTEAQSPAGELFGRERVITVLAGSGREPLTAVVDRLVEAVLAFEGGGDLSDDLTVLALRLSGP